MTNEKRRLIRIVVRFQNAVDDANESFDEAYEYDREFDGGEFSGPAIQRMFEREQERLARRFGFATADLAYAAADLVGAMLRSAWCYR